MHVYVIYIYEYKISDLFSQNYFQGISMDSIFVSFSYINLNLLLTLSSYNIIIKIIQGHILTCLLFSTLSFYIHAEMTFKNNV